jgi:pimeloyl-ACP methyl ester carboxylesterase
MASAYDAQLSMCGDGRAVVLVPGMNGSGELFYCQVPRLRQSFRVATYRLRDDAENLDVLAEDLARVVDIAAPEDRCATIVGESFGGAIALTFALRYPRRVERLVILNSFPYFAPQVRLRLAITGLTVLPWGAMRLVRHLTAFRLHSRHTHHRQVRQFIRLTAHASRDGYMNRLKLLKNFDVRDRLHEIRSPTLFLASERDHLVPAVAQARDMAARVPSSVMRILKGHGHICLIAPDLDLAEIIREWR